MANRKQIRCPGYDYTTPGAYFITTCVKDMESLFGNVVDGKSILNRYGEIVKEQWQWLFCRYSYLKIDAFVIMPNHFHGIIHIMPDVVGNGRDRSLQHQGGKIKPIPELVGAFKTTSSKRIHLSGCTDFCWQKSYHDRIIRNNEELNKIRSYIQNNSSRWGNG